MQFASVVAVVMMAVVARDARAQGPHGAATGHTPQEQRSSCTITGQSQQPLTLADGRTVTIDANDLVPSHESLLLTGPSTHVFPKGTTAGRLQTVLEDSVIGVVRDSEGRLALIPNPLLGHRIYNWRAVADEDRGWHAILYTRPEGADDPNRRRPSDADSISVWYGRLNDTSWTDVRYVRTFEDALANADYSSAAVFDRGRLTVAFPFRRSRIGERQVLGAILLQQRDSIWVVDSLRTRGTLSYIRLGADTLGLVAGVISQPFEGRRGLASSVMLARYSDSWEVPKWIGGDGQSPTKQPAMALLDRGIALTWVSSDFMSTTNQSLQWVLVDSSGARSSSGVVATGPESRSYEMVALDRHRALWIVRHGMARDSVRLIVNRGDKLASIGVISMPLDNLAPAVRAISGSHVAIASFRREESPLDVPWRTYITDVFLECDDSSVG